MRRRTVLLVSIASSIALLSTTASSGSPAGPGWDRLPRKRIPWTIGRSTAHVSPPSARAGTPAEPFLDNFELVGHTDLGATDTNGDVWVHGDYAYVGRGATRAPAWA